MTEFIVEHQQVLLRENIPLDGTELAAAEQELVMLKKLPPLIALIVLPVAAFICWLIRDKFSTFYYYDFILLAGATVVSYGFVYLIGWLMCKYDTVNIRKDIACGKSKLTSVLINRDKTEHGEYLTFAGEEEGSKIRLLVTEEEYTAYAVEMKVIITYLKHSKKLLTIARIS